MNKRQKERLLKLADAIEKLDDKNFDLRSYVKLKGDIEDLKQKKLNCGTTCCAIGWMPSVFPRICEWKLVDEYHGDINVMLKNDPYVTGYEVAREVFGLSDYEAWFLFDPDYYPEDRRGKKSVLRRIRRFIESGLPENYGIWTYLKP